MKHSFRINPQANPGKLLNWGRADKEVAAEYTIHDPQPG
jgi:hypothetical protein